MESDVLLLYSRHWKSLLLWLVINILSVYLLGDIFYASIGTEHVAHPRGEARVLVIESEGSV
jgi:hypothetical protein